VGLVTWTPRAGTDLDEIWLNLALGDPAAADRLIDRIVARCRILAEHPHLGPARPEIAPAARLLVIDDYLVFYRAKGRDVEIVRVVHGARRLEGLSVTTAPD
jgi:toxin ParE1/3/4